jgi:hypothetical protein
MLNVAVAGGLIVVAVQALGRAGDWISAGNGLWRSIFALCLTTLWLLGTVTVSAWIWAGVFMGAGAFGELEPALYFSVVTLTTLGYGDIILDERWRLIAGVCAANGLLLFGLCAAFLVELFRALLGGRDR